MVFGIIMAKYQTNNNSGFSRSLFNSCFGDVPIEEQIKLVEKLSKVQEVCRL